MNIEPVQRVLDSLGASYALIGAHAMAARGYPRFTVDVDLLTTDPRVLDRSVWAGLEDAGATVEARRGMIKIRWAVSSTCYSQTALTSTSCSRSGNGRRDLSNAPSGDTGQVQEWACNSDATALAIVDKSHRVRVFDVDGGEKALGLGYSVAFSPDGRLLAVADRGRVRLWEGRRR